VAGLTAYTPDDREEIEAFLGDPPSLHAYLLSRLGRDDEGQAFVHRKRGRTVGAAWIGSGRNLVFAGEDEEFLEALAALALERERRWVMAVAPYAPASRFLELLAGRTRRRPRLDRAQAYYVVDADSLADLREPELRPATDGDLGALTAASARMSAEDFEIEPWRIDRAAVRRRVARKIREGRAFLYEEEGEVVFKADFAFCDPAGGQVEGVYTVGHRRGEGIASRCMAELCRRGLEEMPELTLHVSLRNAGAIRAYERAGFRRIGELRLTIFPDRPV